LHFIKRPKLGLSKLNSLKEISFANPESKAFFAFEFWMNSGFSWRARCKSKHRGYAQLARIYIQRVNFAAERSHFAVKLAM